MSARRSTKLRRRVVNAQEVTIIRKDWKVESISIYLKEGRLALNPEGPGVVGLVEGPEVASLVKGPEASSAVKGPGAGRLVRDPEVVVEDRAVGSFVKSQAAEGLQRNPKVKSPMKGHLVRCLVEDQELVRKRKDSEVGSILKMKGVESFSKVET